MIQGTRALQAPAVALQAQQVTMELPALRELMVLRDYRVLPARKAVQALQALKARPGLQEPTVQQDHRE